MPQPAPFLERKSYRQRRMVDAARLLPFAGGVGFLLPLTWRAETPAGVETARGGLYLFAIWFLLIAAAYVLSRRLRGGAADSRARD